MMQAHLEDAFMVTGAANTRSKGANQGKPVDSKDGLFPFICGYCYGSYNQIVAFYKHFKEHSGRVDAFHSCDIAETEVLKRDSCERADDSSSFTCNRCSLTLPTICSLHEHIQEHEPTGSYTVDIQTSTGYPSQDPFPFVKLTPVANKRDVNLTRVSNNESDVNLTPVSNNKSDVNLTPVSNNKPDVKLTRVSNNKPDVKLTRVSKNKSDVKLTQVSNNKSDVNLNRVSNNKENLPVNPSCRRQTRQRKRVVEVNEEPELEQHDETEKIKCEFSTTESVDVNSEDDNIDNEFEEIDDGVCDDEDWTEEKNAEITDNESDVDSDIETKSDDNIQRNKKRTREDKKKRTRGDKKKKTKGIVGVYHGRRKFLHCDICGEWKEQCKLNKHVEKNHPGIELSEEFRKTLEYLEGKVQHRKFTKRRKIDSEVEDWDEEFAISDESKLDKSHELVLFQTKKKSFMKCRYCGILVQKSNIGKHEKFHRTRAGKLMYSRKNLSKCETCLRVVLKTNMHKHKCIEMTIKQVNTELPEAGTDGEKKEKRKRKKKKYVYEKLSCHVCGILVKRHSIKKHLLGHTDARPYQCDQCDKSFKFSESCKKHIQDVHGERRFQCDQCPKAFTTASMLKDHYQIHTDERPHPCPQCGRRFRRKSQMKSHAFTHGGEPHIPCAECGKKFMRQTNLTEHVKAIHLKIRNWLCSWPECTKTFCTGTTLRRHMLTHTGEKPVKCGHCDAAFTQRTELKLHLLRKHNIDKLPAPTGNPYPYSGVPHCVVGQEEACPDDQGNQQATVIKTVMFSAAKTSNSDLFSPLQVKNSESVKPNTQSQTHAISGTQNTVAGTNPVIQHQYLSNLKVEPGSSSIADAGLSVSITGTSAIAGTRVSADAGISTFAGTGTNDYVVTGMFDNANKDISVFADTSSSYNASIGTCVVADTSNTGIADTNTSTYVIIDTSDITGIGTGVGTDTHAIINIRSGDMAGISNGTDIVDTSVNTGSGTSLIAGTSEGAVPVYNAIQGTSLLPIREEVHKSELVPSNSEYQYDYITDSPTLTTMTPVLQNTVNPQ